MGKPLKPDQKRFEKVRLGRPCPQSAGEQVQTDKKKLEKVTLGNLDSQTMGGRQLWTDERGSKRYGARHSCSYRPLEAPAEVVSTFRGNRASAILTQEGVDLSPSVCRGSFQMCGRNNYNPHNVVDDSKLLIF